MKNRPWFQHYEKGVPHHIEESFYNSLTALFNDTLKRYSDKMAFTNMGVSITFRQLDILSDNFATFLFHDLKMQKRR